MVSRKCGFLYACNAGFAVPKVKKPLVVMVRPSPSPKGMFTPNFEGGICVRGESREFCLQIIHGELIEKSVGERIRIRYGEVFVLVRPGADLIRLYVAGWRMSHYSVSTKKCPLKVLLLFCM